MQSTRTAHLPPRVEERGRSQAFRAPTEPFGELEKQLSADLVASGRMMLSAARSMGAGSEAVAVARAGYLVALNRLSRLRPGLPLWQLERMALPDELKYVKAGPFGLPSSLIPFSPGDVWRDRELEGQVLARSPPDADPPIVRRLAILLDRFVRSDMALESISDFYRPSVSRLVDAGGDESPRYVHDLLSASRSLSRLAIPFLLAQNASLLNLSLHKDRCIKTGDALGESEPARRQSYIRDKKTAPAVARIKVGRTALSRLGLELGSDEVANTLSQKWGLPMPEELSEQRLPGATREEMEPHLTFNISGGRETTYSHPDLPGMEFSAAECEKAYRLVSEAARARLGENCSGDEADMLVQSEEFGRACDEGDGRMQLRWALAVIKMMQRSDALSADEPERDRLEVYRLAAEDFRFALNMVAQYDAEKASPSLDQHMVPMSIRKMKQAGEESPGTPPFDLALMVIDEKRRNRQSLTTMIPARSLNHPPAGQPDAEAEVVVEVPPQQAPPADLAAAAPEEFPPERPTMEMPLIPSAITGMIPIQNVALDPELESALPPNSDQDSAAIRHLSRYLAHCLMYGFTEQQMPVFLRPAYAKLLEAGPGKAVRLLSREIPSDSPAIDFSTQHNPFEQEGYIVRPAEIIGAVTALVKGTDFSSLRSVPPKPPEEEHVPEGDEVTERREFDARPDAAAAHAPPAEKPLLVLPLDNCILDDRLEALLPEKTGPRTRYIRHASRILGYYLIFGVEDGGVHELYLDAVRSLRGQRATHKVPLHYIDGGTPREGRFKELHGYDFSPSDVVRMATGIVDGCDTSKVLLREDYALLQARAASEARQAEAKLAEAELGEADTDLAPAPSRKDSLGPMLRKLMPHELELIAGVVGAQACDEDALDAFLAMHPGRRELAIRNHVDSRWTTGDWRDSLEKARAAAKSVYRQLKLAAPTREQMAEAVRDPSSLTAEQRGMIASIFMIGEQAVQPVHVDGFAAWVSGDQARISAFWDGFFVDPHRLILLAGKMAIPNSRFNPEEQALLSWLYDKPFESITAKEAYNPAHATECARVMQELKSFWVYTPPEERRRIWKRPDLLSAGELAHKLRFGKGSRLGRDELRVLGAVLGRRIADPKEITEHDMARITAAMVQHTTSAMEILRKVRGDSTLSLGPEEKAVLSLLLGRRVESCKELTGADLDYAQHVYQQRASSGGDEKFYYSELVNIASFGRDAHPASLLAAAQREGELATILEFLGEKVERAEGRLDYSAGLSRPKRKNGGLAKTNDDSFSGAVVTLPDGRRITLDLVCDGMGGMDKGAAGPLPNGQVASNIAKDVFEISAAAGWIATPEDARRAVVVADLAVTMEQMHRKASFDRPQQELPPLEFEAQRFKQQNVMGTTMVIGMQDGRKFWGIHCGDSEWKVLRGDAVAYEATGHSFEYHVKEQYGITLEAHYRSQFGNAAQQTVMQSWMASPEHAAALGRQDPQWVAEFDKQVSQTLEQMVAERVSVSKSIVSAGLAQNTQYLQINNRESGYEPIYLRDGDVTMVVSDGITVPICNHEFRTLIDMAGGDLAAACRLAVEHAEARMTKGPHQTMCPCQSREGKNDDKSITMRYAAPGFGDREAMGRLQADPRAFAYSPERLAMLGLCANGQTGLPQVKEMLDAFIDAAESAPDRTRNDVFTVSVATIFDIVSQRKERDELLDYIAPRVGGWSGLLMKKLLKSPDFSPRKEMMLAIVARSVDQASLASLAGARNSQIAAAAARLGGKEPPSVAQQPAHPQPIFRSQRSESGRQLGPLETRYLDSYLIDLHESPIVQETAAKLRVLPRDLEIMVFNVYADFNPVMAMDPHATVEGQNLISEVWIHLSTGDAKNILTSSYLIYRLRETVVEPADLGKYLDVLWRSVKSMDSTTSYARTYFNETIRLIKQFNPEDPRC